MGNWAQFINVTQNSILADHGRIADSFFRRLKGLLGTTSLPGGQGLLIRPCNSVHTFGMRYSIDVLFVGKDNRIQKIVPAMPSGRIAVSSGSAYVIELPAGTVQTTNTKTGDQLQINMLSA